MSYQEKIKPLYIIIIIFAASFLGVQQLSPPADEGKNISGDLFSAKRALEHLKIIGQKPRVPGEEYHAGARNYIKNTLEGIGLETEVQTELVVAPDRRQVPFSSGRVNNIIGHLPGKSEKAILFMAHYDSVPSGPGVGDNAVAVAAMLETARILSEETSLAHDLIFLFTDGHEYGLLGARAFLNEHAYAKKVNLVFNFEGQGPAGPVYMFRGNNLNGELIEALQNEVTQPRAASFSQYIFDFLPFINDFSLFIEQDYRGLDMGIVSDLAFYHSELDSLENLDPRSLQHHGEYMLGLARYFSEKELEAQDQEMITFFNLTRDTLISYNQLWTFIVGAIALLLLIAYIYLNRKTKLEMLMGFLLILLAQVTASGIIFWFRWITGLNFETYRSTYFQIGFAAFSIFIVFLIFLFLGRSLSLKNMAGGVYMTWGLGIVITLLFFPDAAFIFTWPVLVTLPFHLLGQRFDRLKGILVLPAAFNLFFLLPQIIMLYKSLTLALPEPPSMLLISLIGLIFPALEPVVKKLGLWIITIPGVICLIFLLSGFAGYDADHPLRNTLSYFEKAGQSFWITFDAKPDEWINKYVGENEFSYQNPVFYPVGQFWKEDTEVFDIQGPRVEVMQDSYLDKERLLRLRLFSPREASTLLVNLESDTKIYSSSVGGKPVTGNFEPEWYWGLRFNGLPREGIEIEFRVPLNEKVKISVTDQTYRWCHLPPDKRPQRPAHMMANPQYYHLTDSVFIQRIFEF